VTTPPPPPPPGYGPPPPGYGPPDGALAGELASWGLRVQSALVDWFVPFLVAGIVYRVNAALGFVVYLAALAWALYNAYLQGTTGQSTGKKMAGTRLLHQQTGQPIGGGAGIGRAFVHILDGIPCYLGYLWPLWDSKKQTFADKIMSTVVVKA
jgi:uncharacterized RDD family membrane protein YckC